MNKVEKFNKLVNALKSAGYEVEVKKHEIYKCASLSGNGIRGVFGTAHEENHLYSNYYINDKIVADNDSCFDKPRNCALQYYIPEKDEDINFLLERLKYWGSSEGYELSNDFNYDQGNYK